MPRFLSPWTSAPKDLCLEKGEVHLWRFPLDLPPQKILFLKQFLAADELQRARRLLDPLKAERFISARGQLRQVLSRYLPVVPADLRFSYGSNGKPSLEQGPIQTLSFNLSHSGSWALLALATDCEIGVDLEEIDSSLTFEAIARQFFSPAENTWLSRFSPPRRRRAFYRLWTKKEAWLKALGWGFANPLSSLDLEEATRGDGRWRVKNFAVSRNYLGALAIDREISSIRCWQQ